eukprot:gb/GECG01002923.1/.p1 GENE.gb/GECG01002923.1/~~gb/GECG01002923.1/.p1  ORF type:complete len:606 (+),score=48.31 gb/GECG01002923.1/:1-1818(+)
MSTAPVIGDNGLESNLMDNPQGPEQESDAFGFVALRQVYSDEKDGGQQIQFQHVKGLTRNKKGKGDPVELTLYFGGLRITPRSKESCIEDSFFPNDCLLGATIDDVSYEEVVLHIHTYPLETASRGTCCSSNGDSSRTYKEICIRINIGSFGSETAGAASIASMWATSIVRFARGLPLKPQTEVGQAVRLKYPDDTPLPSFQSADVAQLTYTTVKVIISPVSGPGKGPRFWEDVWKDMFKNANVAFDTVYTERSAHATEIAGTLNVARYNGIVCIGGDGMVHEVVQGLMTRSDWKVAISKLSIGVLPGGSGNGIARSLCELKGEQYKLIESCFITLKGISRPSPVDIASVLLLDESSSPIRRLYTIQHLEWGLIADIDIESERCRCLGDLRFTAQGIVRGLGLRAYEGEFMYLPADPESQGGPMVSRGLPETDIPDKEGPGPNTATDQPDTLAIPTSVHGHDNWVHLDGRFSTIWALQTKFQSVDVQNSPKSELSDGVFYLLIIREINEFSMTKVLLDMDEKGSIGDNPNVELVPAQAYRLSPSGRVGGCCRSSLCCYCACFRSCSKCAVPRDGGILTVDGELLDEYMTVESETHRGLMNLMVST